MGKVKIKECKAECCGIVPIDRNLVQKHKDKMRKGARLIVDAEDIQIWVKNGSCAFLSKHYKCLIYEDRPDVCRIMGDFESSHPMLKCSYLRTSDEEKEFQAYLESKDTILIHSKDWEEYYRLKKKGIEL